MPFIKNKDYNMNKKFGIALPVSGRLAALYFEYEMGKYTKGHKEYVVERTRKPAKKILFGQWADTHFKTSPLLVYVFLDRHRRGLCVGKTGCGISGPLSQFDKQCVSKVKFILVYKVSSRKYLDKAKYLAIGYYMPRRQQRLPCRQPFSKSW
jgi:hypothetical protein